MSDKSKKWHFKIFCGRQERPATVHAASCALECGDRYVWRDAAGNWIAEVLAVAVVAEGVTPQDFDEMPSVRGSVAAATRRETTATEKGGEKDV